MRELRRVARDAVVILTYDARVSAAMWLMTDYLPEVADLDRRTSRPPSGSSSGSAAAPESNRCRSRATRPTG